MWGFLESKEVRLANLYKYHQHGTILPVSTSSGEHREGLSEVQLGGLPGPRLCHPGYSARVGSSLRHRCTPKEGVRHEVRRRIGNDGLLDDHHLSVQIVVAHRLVRKPNRLVSTRWFSVVRPHT
jgi:hypothetical protein